MFLFVYYTDTLKQELSGTKAYEQTSEKEKSVINNHIFHNATRYNHPYQIVSRTVKYQSFVINIINLLGALYLISINLFLILISKLVPLTLELARTLNIFIRLQVKLLRAI